MSVIEIAIKSHMERSFLDYSMSVITDRALPDLRDGLKPVHRRILFAMKEMGLTHDKAFKKSAGVVGDVLKNYHPHGDGSVYDAAVRMAQPWSLLHPLIDGQGNFGSVDGDSAAAYRYTEMKLTKLAGTFFESINKNTVNFRPNFDNSQEEPEVLPVPYPNILVNGTSGIAVGMATSIPPHNLGEIITALLAYIDDENLTVEKLIEYIPAPDFPTGGIVSSLEDYATTLTTGRGRVKLRGSWHAEDRKGGCSIVLDSIPYQVNKAVLVSKIADLVREKQIEDIVDLRDESSNQKGMRVVIDLRRDTSPEVVINQLIARTDFETSVNYNMMVLHGGAPKQVGVLEIFKHYLSFQFEIIQRATQFDLTHFENRLHVLEALLKALDCLDEVIKTIRNAKDGAMAKERLMELLTIDGTQADAILEIRLVKLTNLEILQVQRELDEVTKKIKDLTNILKNRDRQVKIIKGRLSDIREAYLTPRLTTIRELEAVNTEDLVEREDIAIVITKNGYVKRVSLSTLNKQNRGTRGKSIIATDEGDFVTTLHTGSTHDYLLAFTDSGQVYAKKAYLIPEGGAATKGRHVRNIFDGLAEADNIIRLLTVPSFTDPLFLLTVSRHGSIKRTPIDQFDNSTRKGGIQGVKVDTGDTIVGVDICREGDNVFLVSSSGKAIRMVVDEEQLRPMGRASIGSRGMRINTSHDSIISLIVTSGNPDDQSLLCVGSRGVGKRTLLTEFEPQARGGVGVTCFNLNKRTGTLVKSLAIKPDDNLLLITLKGVTNRIKAEDIRKTTRIASGSTLMSLDSGDVIVDASAVIAEDEEENAAAIV